MGGSARGGGISGGGLRVLVATFLVFGNFFVFGGILYGEEGEREGERDY